MFDNSPSLIADHFGRADSTNNTRALLDLAIGFAPLLTVGVLGEWIGDSTAFGAVLINVAYLLSLLLVTIVLWSRNTSWMQLGMSWPKSWPKTVLLALGLTIVAILANVAVQVLVQVLPGVEIVASDRSSYDPMTGNLPLFILYLVGAWTIVAFGEEMMFRAFLIDRLAALCPNVRARWALALLGSSLFFGLAHLSWGLAGVIDTMIMGLVLGGAYLVSGRNLWVTIIAHSLMNTLGFVQIFLGWTA